MALTALNRSTVTLLTNQSGGSVAQGDVVIIDSANASSFTTTTTGAYSAGLVGVVLEPNGIASAAQGLIAFGGYVPKVNLSGSASLGDLFKTHTVAKQAVRHAGPIVAGDIGEVLATGTAPAALLWGQPATGTSGPAGELGFTQITTASLTTTSTSLVDLAGVTVTVTIGSRPVVVSAYIPQWSHSAASGRALFALIDSTASAQIQDAVVVGDASNNSDAVFLSIRVNPSAGSRVFKVQYRAITAGTVTVNSGSTAPSYIQVVEV